MRIFYKTSPWIRDRALLLAVILALGVFVLDLSTTGIVSSILYSLIILLFLRPPFPPVFSFILAAVFSVLIILGGALRFLRDPVFLIIFHHLLAFSLVWLCALLTYATNMMRVRRLAFIKEIKRSRQRLRQAIRVARVMVYELSCPGGEIRNVEGLEELTGRRVGELDGKYKTWFNWIHPEDFDEWYKKVQSAAKNPSANSVITQYRLHHKKGHYMLIEDNTSFIRSEKGEVLRVLGAAFDITKRRQVEDALQESQRNYRMIADALPVLIAYIDKEQRFQFSNATFERWFGIPPETIKDKYIWEVIGRKTYSQIYPYIDKALRGQQANFELPMRDQDHHKRLPDVTLLPCFAGDGEVVGLYALSVDMTERKQTEQLLTARLRELAIVHALSTELTQSG